MAANSVSMRPFYISRYEMTNAEFNHFGCAAAQPSQWADDNRPREKC